LWLPVGGAYGRSLEICFFSKSSSCNSFLSKKLKNPLFVPVVRLFFSLNDKKKLIHNLLVTHCQFYPSRRKSKLINKKVFDYVTNLVGWFILCVTKTSFCF
jgi:hypothetical protein